MRSPQVWLIVVCLFATLLIIQARGDVDQVPPSAPLEQLPARLADWNSQDIAISPEALEILGEGRLSEPGVYRGRPTRRCGVQSGSTTGACPAIHCLFRDAAVRPVHSLPAELPSGVWLDVCAFRCD